MNDILTFLVLTLFVIMSPGIDTALITKRTMADGQTGGYKMALGLASGSLVHTLAATFGLSALLLQSALAFEIVKYAGAIYLMYLGISAFLSKKQCIFFCKRGKVKRNIRFSSRPCLKCT